MGRLAILGGGQLGRFLMEAAAGLGVPSACFDPNPSCSASVAAAAIGPGLAEVVTGSFDDLDAVRRFAEGAEAVTCEWESVPLETLEAAAGVAPLRPGVESFAAARDRFAEQKLFERVDVDRPRSVEARDAATLEDAVRVVRESSGGGGVVLKSRFGGYDGKGQARVAAGASMEEAVAAYESIGGGDVLCQETVPFSRELSVVVARSEEGQVEVYSPVANEHRSGILYCSRAPAGCLGAELRSTLKAAASALVTELGHVGVLAAEFFLCDAPDGAERCGACGGEWGGRVLANEVAPRVHNSGHWTLGSGLTTQFEQHVRAVLGRPLAKLGTTRWSGMVNLVGRVPAGIETLRGRKGFDIRLYGKAERPGRKLGHVSVHGESEQQREALLQEVCSLVAWDLPEST